MRPEKLTASAVRAVTERVPGAAAAAAGPAVTGTRRPGRRRRAGRRLRIRGAGAVAAGTGRQGHRHRYQPPDGRGSRAPRCRTGPVPGRRPGRAAAAGTGSFDGITCSLALHYIADWSVPLRSFASALRPGGWAVISLDHPFGPPTPDQRGGYFDTELVSDTWRKADVEVTQQFWRRPLAAVLGAFADAGFLVDRVAEAQPSAEAVRLFPDDLGPVVGVPTFIVCRLWLRP
jgi:SAM-dependent methyltransferase